MPFIPRFSLFPFSLPKRSQRNPLNIKTTVRAIATMVFPTAAWSTNEMTKEIAAPIKLNGSHFLIARLSKVYTYMIVNLRCEAKKTFPFNGLRRLK
jgi:hypothetical protein